MQSPSCKSRIQGIYVITDEQLKPGRTHVGIARASLAGGAQIIQLRDKNSSDDRLVAVGKEIQELCNQYKAIFIVNDRLEVAIACDADGIHVGQEDISSLEIRSKFPQKIIGVSVSTIEEARQAATDGADYLGVGPIFGTTTKLDADHAVGIGRISEMKEASGLPIVAIGGINEANIADVAKSEADSASVISAVVCADDMKQAVERLVKIWKDTRSLSR